MNPTAWLAVLILAAAPVAAAGQDLAARITGGGDGTVRMRFAVRDGVEICEEGIRLFGDRITWRDGRGAGERCAEGPAEIEIRVRDGSVARAKTLRLGEEPEAGARDLGLVDAQEALEALLALARRGAGRGSDDLVFPAVLADVDGSWRRILALAEDRDAPREARKAGLFWVGQEAAHAATEGLARVARADDEDQDVRNAAIFALSQRAPEESLPVLMELARTADEAETRRTAFFWLAQVDDDRVTAFFRQVLLGGG